MDKYGQPQFNKTLPKTETNAKLVKWKDGSFSIAVGKKYFNLKELPSKNTYIFEKKTEISTKSLN